MTDPVFAESATVRVGDLKVGDFLETVPTQEGVRGTRFNSAVREIQDDSSFWRSGYSAVRSKSFYVLAQRTDNIRYVYPDHFVCTARVRSN
jgi:hypothetical protein